MQYLSKPILFSEKRCLKFMWDFKEPLVFMLPAVTKISEAGLLISNRNLSLIDLEHRKSKVKALVDFGVQWRQSSLCSQDSALLMVLQSGYLLCLQMIEWESAAFESFYKGLLPSPKALPSCLVASQRPHFSGLSQWIPSSNLNLQKTMKNENNPPKRTKWSSAFLISKGTLKQICAAYEVECGV